MNRIMVRLLGALVTYAALNPQVSTTLAQLISLTNPTPASSDFFGFSVAGMGGDRMLIGAYQDGTGAFQAGAAHLFSTNGTLVTTFTNPTPAIRDCFGYSVAGVGTDRVLVGAYQDDTGAFDTGAAYLFSTNGGLLTTFTNPTPAFGDNFGSSVAAVGEDRVLIAAFYDDTGAVNAGAAYLFSTNGALLTTFTNPTPGQIRDFFGYSVAGVGIDRVLIGSPQENMEAQGTGVAYLFNINGALLTTFTNPTPQDGDNFGGSVAAAGGDRVLIGAFGDWTGAFSAGAAYLFSTNGALLTTFTNPTPAEFDWFGSSVAAVGTDRVLIGAHRDLTGALYAGAAYLFSTNGALLTTFTNPTPADSDYFGWCVASVGTDRVLIGAYQDNTGATDAGAAYLFSTAVQTPRPPSLTIRITTTNTVAVSWPSPSTNWTLQENTNGISSVNWSNAPGTIQDDGMNKIIIVNPPAGNRFYRLAKPGS